MLRGVDFCGVMFWWLARFIYSIQCSVALGVFFFLSFNNLPLGNMVPINIVHVLYIHRLFFSMNFFSRSLPSWYHKLFGAIFFHWKSDGSASQYILYMLLTTLRCCSAFSRNERWVFFVLSSFDVCWKLSTHQQTKKWRK